MGYDLVILPKSWFFTKVYKGKFDTLAEIVNTAYDRPKDKYGIIKTRRIKDAQNFPADLQFSDEKDVFMTLLLGNPVAETVKVTQADADFVIDKTIESRILATVGFKTYDRPVKSPSVVEYEMTAFTSFLRGIAPKLLDFVINMMFENPKTPLFDYTSVSTVQLHASVIRDHDLVPYYSKYCGFERHAIPDLLIETNASNSPLEEGIVATRDFYLAFLRRTIYLKK
ncbi:hypothetical protein SBP28_001925 [Candidozyma auris]